MGNLSDSMQTLVDEITASAQTRRNRLQELTDETKDALEGYRAGHEEMAEALREKLSSERNAGIEATRELMNDIHSANRGSAEALWQRLSSEEQARREAAKQLMEELEVTISEMRSDTHNLLERYSLGHRDMANALREKLSSERNAGIEATRELMEETHKVNDERREAVRAMLGEVASDLGQARQIWTGGLKKKVAPEVVAVEEVAAKEAPEAEGVAEEVEERPEVEAALSLFDEERILEVVATHPEGIRLVDIGNELGVDWRTLIRPSRSLVEEGRMEKIEALYYPKERGSQGEEEEVV